MKRWVWIFVLLGVVAVASFGRARQATQEELALTHLKVLVAALDAYRTNTDPETYPTQLFLSAANAQERDALEARIPNFMLQNLSQDNIYGYRFAYKAEGERTIAEEGESYVVFPQYVLTATPLVNTSKKRSFYVDRRGLIRVASSAAVSGESPYLE